MKTTEQAFEHYKKVMEIRLPWNYSRIYQRAIAHHAHQATSSRLNENNLYKVGRLRSFYGFLLGRGIEITLSNGEAPVRMRGLGNGRHEIRSPYPTQYKGYDVWLFHVFITIVKYFMRLEDRDSCYPQLAAVNEIAAYILCCKFGLHKRLLDKIIYNIIIDRVAIINREEYLSILSEIGYRVALFVCRESSQLELFSKLYQTMSERNEHYMNDNVDAFLSCEGEEVSPRGSLDEMYAQSHDHNTPPFYSRGVSAHEQVEEESVINRDGGHECTRTYDVRGRSEDE